MIFGELGLGDITKTPLGGVAGWVYCVKESVQIFIESSGFSIAWVLSWWRWVNSSPQRIDVGLSTKCNIFFVFCRSSVRSKRHIFLSTAQKKSIFRWVAKNISPMFSRFDGLNFINAFWILPIAVVEGMQHCFWWLRFESFWAFWVLYCRVFGLLPWCAFRFLLQVVSLLLQWWKNDCNVALA